MKFDNLDVFLGEFSPGVGTLERENLRKYSSFLEEEAAKLNLMSPRELQGLDLHLKESLLPLSISSGLPDWKLGADVGTGAGLPGLPLAIARPELKMLLIESRGKKVDFLQSVKVRLGLQNVTISHGRAESIAHEQEFRERCDVVTSKASASLPVALEISAGFLRVNGHLLLFKGAAWKSEFEYCKDLLDQLSLELVSSYPYQLPGFDQRFLLVVGKNAPTDSRFPRSTQRLKHEKKRFWRKMSAIKRFT